MRRLLITNARFAGEKAADGWLLIEDEMIAAVGHGAQPAADETIDARGYLVMPGAIDCHVHFREPGLTRKADISSESRAAIAGGVTSYLEMPNTQPPTTTIEAWERKCAIAAEKSAANYAFFIGATNDNLAELRRADYTRVPGVKLFMGSSTGNMLVDSDSAISQLFCNIKAIIAVHAEDQAVIDENARAAKQAWSVGVPVAEHSRVRSAEACYRSTQKAVHLAEKYGARLHVCHLTTARELQLLQSGPLEEKTITAEVSPHHLLWCDDDYEIAGSRIKMNPAVKTAADRQALREAVADGLIDIVATDHAPHELRDKEGDAFTAASGAPMVQFSLAAMLDLFDEATVQRVMCENPARLYGISRRGHLAPGCYADIAIVRSVEPYVVSDADVVSKCGWTPMRGRKLRHRVAMTIVNGAIAYADGHFADSPKVMPLLFER